MHFHLPKPLHGWRAFTGEVGIIVIGVLIALGAEQLVENWRWRSHVVEAKDDLKSELYDALYQSRERSAGQACVERKLERLETLIDRPSPPAVPIGLNIAPIRPWSTSAWDSVIASEAVTHMRPDERTQYAGIYSMIRSTHDLNMDEFKAGTELAMLRHGGPLSEQTQDRLRSTIAQLRGYNAILGLGGAQMSRKIHELGIELKPEDELAIIGRHCRMPDEPDIGIP